MNIKYKIHPNLQKALSDYFKIIEFTEIQKKCIPVIDQGKNVLALAETGSGKTLSYIIPLLNKIIDTPKKPTKILIVTPTKELAEQVLKVVKTACRETNILATSIYGGKSFSEQSVEINRGVHLIVGCPGRLRDHIDKKTLDLNGIEYLVLDEADQLLDMGFLPAVLEISKGCSRRKQTILISATFESELQSLAHEIAPDYELIRTQSLGVKKTINENFYPISKDLMYPFLRFIIKHFKIKSCIIFTRTKDEATKLGSLLLADKYNVATLQGDMTTHQRKKALDSLKFKKSSILVATDLASRGIDIPHLTHVINFGIPESLDSYIHRIGRTARHENLGDAITLYSEEHSENLKKILGDIPWTPRKIKEFNYNLKIDSKSLSKRKKLQ